MKYLWIVMLVIVELVGWWVSVLDCIATYRQNDARVQKGQDPVVSIYDFTIIWIRVHTILFVGGTFLYSLILYFGG